MSARVAALDRLARQTARFPDLDFVDASAPPTADGARLDARDASLARAIEHAVIRRWLTLAAVCRACIDRRWENVDERIQAALMAGAAQMLLFGQQADHAVVDETVEWTKRKGQRGAPGFVNAVLRRIAALRGEMIEAAGSASDISFWHDRADAMPLEDGRILLLTKPVFSSDRIARLSEQTSHHENLILHWMNAVGRDKATARAVHGLVNAPIIVTGAEDPASGAYAEFLAPHQQPNFWVWQGKHTQLLEMLAAHPTVRVQDPASARPVLLTRTIRPQLILDACAGRGTKTRQLAHEHPQAEIVATDIDAGRLRALALAFEGHPRVKVTTPEGLRGIVGKCDLVVLDVPCSNTGVLARRPEARYRFNRVRLQGLVDLQRRIVNEHLPFVAPGGSVLFSTCSLEKAENEQQAEWLAKRAKGRAIASERHEPEGLPGTPVRGYSDGSFGVVVQIV